MGHDRFDPRGLTTLRTNHPRRRHRRRSPHDTDQTVLLPHRIHAPHHLRVDIAILNSAAACGKSIFNKCVMGLRPDRHEPKNGLLMRGSISRVGHAGPRGVRAGRPLFILSFRRSSIGTWIEGFLPTRFCRAVGAESSPGLRRYRVWALCVPKIGLQAFSGHPQHPMARSPDLPAGGTFHFKVISERAQVRVGKPVPSRLCSVDSREGWWPSTPADYNRRRASR
jgi:hypothetical protein